MCDSQYMRTFDRMHTDLNQSGNPCCYWGEHGHWLVVVGRHRDSDTLERSNFTVAQERLKKINPDCCIVESENHWAVGWVEHLLVDPSNTEAVELARAMRKEIEDYPILDENHFNNLEYEKAAEYWAGMNTRDRVEACQESGISIFAARRDYWVLMFDGENDLSDLHEYLTCS